MQEFPQEGFAEFFTEPLTDEEIQKIGGGSLVFVNDENQVTGWTDSGFEPVIPTPVSPPGINPADVHPYEQS